MPLSESHLAGAYLSQALDALSDSANPERLYGREISNRHATSILAGPQRNLDALNARIRLLRTSVLFSALSAEAYANEFLSASLPTRDVEAADKLSAPDKLLLGPRLCGKTDVLTRGAEPHQSITKLFQTRNALVHGKPGRVSGYVGTRGVNDKDADLYGPELAVRYLVAVAHTAMLLHPLRPKTHYTMPFSDIYEHRTILDEHLERTGRDLLKIPSRGDPPTPDLALEMERRRYRLARQSRPETRAGT